jgi:hypothetical protein
VSFQFFPPVYFLVLLHGKEELELWRQFLLAVQAVGKVDTPNAAVRVELNAEIFFFAFVIVFVALCSVWSA